MKILIAPWGYFEKWNEVEYKILIGEEEHSCESKTPLPLLQKVLQPDKTIVLVPDTLYEALGGSGTDDYDEITAFVMEKTTVYLKGLEIEAEVLVLPGVWNGTKISFKGTMTDFYYTALKFLAKELEDGGDGELKIFLDITHGVNFAPVFIYEVLKRLGSVFSLTRNVELTVYNSEPYTPGVSSLQIHKIEEEKISPNFSYTRLSESKEKLLRPHFDLQDEDKARIGKNISTEFELILGNIAQELDAFAASVINLFPLGIFTFYPDSKKLNDLLEKALRFYRENIVVEDRVVRRRVEFGKKYESLVKLKVVADSLQRIGVDRFTEVCIGRLRDLVNSLKRIGKARYYIASNEISNIEKKLKDTRIESWTYLASMEESGERGDSSRNERIFIAHAGLEKTSVEVHPSGLIRYVEEKLNTVKNTITNTL